MPLHFEPIRLEQQADYRRILSQCKPIASDYSFINLWGWGEEYGLEWAWQDGLIWIRQTLSNVLWAPVGDWTAVDWSSALKIAKETADRMIRVPEELLHLIAQAKNGDVHIEDSREHWDYLYNRQDLVELKGNRFHKKKNLLNQFLKKNDYTYLEFGSSMVDQALGMQEDWCAWRDCENEDTLASENNAIIRVLNQWRSLEGITGGALMVDQLIIAYTIAEAMPDKSLIVHFEKACPDHKGGYQAINQIFLSHTPEQYAVVNREQDLGDEGMRKAKLSYNPVDFVKKFQIVL
jgi:hypothetical protein